MLKLRDWRGIPFVAGALTDVLLDLEDCLDQRVPAFVRVLDAEALTARLRQKPSGQQESGVLLNGRVSAALVTYCSTNSVRSVDRDFLMYVLLNLAGDNGERVLVLTDHLNGALGRLKESRLNSPGRIAKVLVYNPSTCVKDMVQAVFQTNAVIVLSDIQSDEDYKLYEKIAWESGRPILWFQMPLTRVSGTFKRRISFIKKDKHAMMLQPAKWRARFNLAYQILQTTLRPG